MELLLSYSGEFKLIDKVTHQIQSEDYHSDSRIIELFKSLGNKICDSCKLRIVTIPDNSSYEILFDNEKLSEYISYTSIVYPKLSKEDISEQDTLSDFFSTMLIKFPELETYNLIEEFQNFKFSQLSKQEQDKQQILNYLNGC